MIREDLAGGKLPRPHAQEEFALKECSAYVSTTAPGDVGGGGVGEEEVGLYDTVSPA